MTMREDGPERLYIALCALILIQFGAACCLAFSITRAILHSLPNNFFGLCSGMGEATTHGTALTLWRLTSRSIIRIVWRSYS